MNGWMGVASFIPWGKNRFILYFPINLHLCFTEERGGKRERNKVRQKLVSFKKLPILHITGQFRFLVGRHIK